MTLIIVLNQSSLRLQTSHDISKTNFTFEHAAEGRLKDVVQDVARVSLVPMQDIQREPPVPRSSSPGPVPSVWYPFSSPVRGRGVLCVSEHGENAMKSA